MSSCFTSADILLPESSAPERWAVIACDQFTSQPEYWREVEQLTERCLSAAHLILPEAELDGNPEKRIREIHETMRNYLREGVFRTYPDCFVYTERRMKNGTLRRGIVGKIDLLDYDYTGAEDAAVRATEKTVTERIPPRVAVRRGAAVELPHVLLLCNDPKHRLIEPLAERKAEMRKLYDFNLMMDGGHVAGWLVEGKEKQALEQRIEEYEAEERSRHPESRMAYAVGDGNHSLASAKACAADSPEARYALVELNNIHEGGGNFEPIHRLVKRCDAERLLRDAEEWRRLQTETDKDAEISWTAGDREGSFMLPVRKGELPLGALQRFLDGWLERCPGELDYIHGEEALRSLAREQNCIGFLLLPIPKAELFPGILSGGVLPRKTFSMGDATDKRYYLEARRIAEA